MSQKPDSTPSRVPSPLVSGNNMFTSATESQVSNVEEGSGSNSKSLSDGLLATLKAKEAANRRFEAARWVKSMVGFLDIPRKKQMSLEPDSTPSRVPSPLVSANNMFTSATESQVSNVEQGSGSNSKSLSDGLLASVKAKEAVNRRFEAATWVKSMVGSLDMLCEHTKDEFYLLLRNGVQNALNNTIYASFKSNKGVKINK